MKENIIEKNPKISIIVPIYNSGLYLEKCLDSIINQSYKNIEIILVNDGSTDNSKEICEKYKEKDKRIIFINQKNQGVSVARNEGLKKATGGYISFVYSDDYISENMLKKMIYKMLKYDSEIVICGNYNVNNKYQVYSMTPYFNEKILETKEAIEELLNEKIFFSTVWGKLYNKKFFIKYKFNEKTRIGEDLEILYNIFKESKRTIYIPDRLYYWNNRNDSLTKEPYNESWESEIKICSKIIEDNKNQYEIKKSAIKRYVRINVTCINNIIKNDLKSKEENLKILKNNIKGFKKEYLKNEKVSTKNKIKFLLAIYCQKIIKLYFFIKKRK